MVSHNHDSTNYTNSLKEANHNIKVTNKCFCLREWKNWAAVKADIVTEESMCHIIFSEMLKIILKY